MAKYLFISPMGEGHINPTIGLVRELVSRGEQVVYYSKNEYRDKLEKAGATFRPISQKAQTLMNEYLTKNMVRRLTNPNIQNIAERIPKMMSMMEWITDDILQEIKGESYDYIIHDAQAAPGEWIANKLQLPTIATWTVFAFKKQSPLFKQLLKQSGPAVLEAMEKMKETFLANKKRLEEKYGVPMKEFPNMACEGDLNIVFTSRYFQPQADFVGENYLFVGPSIADRQDQGDFPLEELKETPVVFMSLGHH